MFNKGNDDFVARPAIISDECIEDIAAFLVRGIADLGVGTVNLVLHGGEPLLMKRDRFRALCASLRAALDPLVELHIAIQTNATLVTPDWIDLFSEFKIDVGVSLDGPPEVHDRYRVDKAGRGTYARTIKGLNVLRSAYNAGRIGKPGAICVIDPDVSARSVYTHLVKELGFTSVSFNLPMETVDTAPADFGKKTAIYLKELFSTWRADGDRTVRIRIFDQMLRFFGGDQALIKVLGNMMTDHLMVVIASDGELSEHDDFKVINFAQRCGNVKDTTLRQFANSSLRTYLQEVARSLPNECRVCDWRNYCRAGVTHGLTVSRYSLANGFNNRSSLCHAFSELFEEGARFLLSNGLSHEQLRNALGLDDAKGIASPVPPIPDPLVPRKLIVA